MKFTWEGDAVYAEYYLKMVNKYHLFSDSLKRNASDTQRALCFVPLLFLFTALYFGIFAKLVHDWYTLPDFSHGFLIPLFVGFLVWKNRERLTGIDSNPSWMGMLLIIPGLIVLLLGVLGSELYLARVSFLFVLAGTVWLLAGMQTLRTFWFAIAVLLLAIPIPQVIFYQITAPLQRLAATCATEILPVVGVPVLQQGNIIHLPSISLEVAEACSGIRSLLSLSTLSVLYGYFAEKEPWRRVVLVACSIPIAVAANALRIVGTGLLVQYRGISMAMGFFHEFSGLLVFVVSVLMLMGMHVLLSRVPVRR